MEEIYDDEVECERCSEVRPPGEPGWFYLPSGVGFCPDHRPHYAPAWPKP